MASPPIESLAHLLERAGRIGSGPVPEDGAPKDGGPVEASGEAGELRLAGGRTVLRRLKTELHLLTALADLGGVWSLEAVTASMTRFADAALQAAVRLAADAERSRGRLGGGSGEPRGLFCLALGKHGAGELNYSSDIDVSVFYDPDVFPAAGEPARTALRFVQTLVEILQARTSEGYVFRVDLRLRPDPSATPAAMPVQAALDYYETFGQNWERAAMIKARVAAGDRAVGGRFLEALQPFIWRRHLDYAAIADIHAIKRQIHVHKVDERLTTPGCDLKLGAGGIREIEFFVQTQQLIYGGRTAALRSPGTLQALKDLSREAIVEPAAAQELTSAYLRLRAWEHRVQMVRDEQSHVLPENSAERRRIAALSGFADLTAFDIAVATLRRGVNARYGALFAEDEPLSSRMGNLVFTGVEDDPDTLETLAKMGFTTPEQISSRIRDWHHGRIAATRTPRGRELLTRLAPRLLQAAAATGAADTAFNRFADFFGNLRFGVQIQSLFLAQPKLFRLVVEVMAFAPRLASTLARQPQALDRLLDAQAYRPKSGPALELEMDAEGVSGFEAAMDGVRRIHREEAFTIGVGVMSGAVDAEAAGAAFADLADACIRRLAAASLAETARVGGAFPGAVAVIALGKAGSREMTAASDLDLMTLYQADGPEAVSGARFWPAETFYARFTQRLVAALSAPTGEGTLYRVDLQLRPSGSAGPVAVSLAAFEGYYSAEAETWEQLALTRARLVWSSAPGVAAAALGAVERSLRRPRNPAAAAADVTAMRQLMRKERAPWGEWDLKLTPGGLVDVEFAAQYLQIVHGAAGGPLRANTGLALEALAAALPALAPDLDLLAQAWRLQQRLSQVLKLALEDGMDPGLEPAPFRRLLARAGRVRSFPALEGGLRRHQDAAARAAGRLISA